MNPEVIRLPRIAEEGPIPIELLRPYISPKGVEKNLGFMQSILDNTLLREGLKEVLQKIFKNYSSAYSIYGDSLNGLSTAPSTEETLSMVMPGVHSPNPDRLGIYTFPSHIEYIIQGSQDIILVASSHALLHPVVAEAQRQQQQKVSVIVIDRHLDNYGHRSAVEWEDDHPKNKYVSGKADVIATLIEKQLAEKVTVFGMTNKVILAALPHDGSLLSRRELPSRRLTLVDPKQYHMKGEYDAAQLRKIIRSIAKDDKIAGITNVYFSIDLDGIRLPVAHTGIDYIPFSPLIVFSLFDIQRVEHLAMVHHNISAVDYTNEHHTNIIAQEIIKYLIDIAHKPGSLLRKDIPQTQEILGAIQNFVTRGEGTQAGLAWEECQDVIREVKDAYRREGIVFGLSVLQGIILGEVTEAVGYDVDNKTANLVKSLIDLLSE